jgi:hypothetical protein
MEQTKAATCDRIFAALSGKVWSAETLDEIAVILSRAGFVIKPPIENDEITTFCPQCGAPNDRLGACTNRLCVRH